MYFWKIFKDSEMITDYVKNTSHFEPINIY